LYNAYNNHHSDISKDKGIYKRIVLVNLAISAQFVYIYK
jgi:hypothetical protein